MTARTALSKFQSIGEQFDNFSNNQMRNGGGLLAVTADVTIDAWGSGGSTEFVWFIDVDDTGGAVTVTLPDPTTETERQFVIRRKTSGSGVTIDSEASGTINGASSVSLASQYQRQRIISNGEEWCLW